MPLFLPYIRDIISRREDNSTIMSIIYSDFVRYCPQKNQTLFKSLFVLFSEGIQNQNQKVQYDSIYGLAIILTPERFNAELMNALIDNLLNNLVGEIQIDMKNMIVFFMLQMIHNYSTFFGASDRFWEMFDENSCLLPKYCIEFFAQSLNFLVTNFANLINHFTKLYIIRLYQKL